MSVVCKFSCYSVEHFMGSRRKRNADGGWVKEGSGFIQEPCLSGRVKLVPVYANDDPNHENSKFWDASPSGEFTMQVNNMAALDYLKPGKQYKITIEEVPQS